MKQKIILLFCALACVTFANAQNKAKFSSINQLGAMTSKGDSKLAAQTVNGALYKGWFAGLGVGWDFHQYFTMPIFLDIRKDFGQKRQKPFVYLDGGIDIYGDVKYGYDYKNGGYFDGGVGYAFYYHKRQAVLLSVGYSYKGFHKENIVKTGMGDYLDIYKYNFNRLSLKVGMRL